MPSYEPSILTAVLTQSDLPVGSGLPCFLSYISLLKNVGLFHCLGLSLSLSLSSPPFVCVRSRSRACA